MQGASQVLVRFGYERANTTLIARAAGVSVGSLYQYYPNKDAIFSALLQASFAEIAEGLRLIVREAPAEPLDARVHRLVSATVAHKAQNPKLHRVLKTELGRLDGAKAMRKLTDQILALLEELFAAYQAELRLRDPARAAFFAFNTVEGVVCAALIDAPDSLGEPSFAEELSTAVSAMVKSLPRTAAA
ncbi:MAG: TetR/AcrR family transcriptional regulator [Polyangiales bacterium]